MKDVVTKSIIADTCRLEGFEDEMISWLILGIWRRQTTDELENVTNHDLTTLLPSKETSYAYYNTIYLR